MNMSKSLLLACLCVALVWQRCGAFRVLCKHADRIHEEHIHKCCKHPDGHNEITELCARETGFRLPARDEEAIEDVTVDQVMRNTCWGKCVFDQYKFMQGNDVDMNAVRLHYKVAHDLDAEYEREMLSAFEKCHGQSEEATAEFLKMPLIQSFSSSHYCDPKPSVILACVIHNFFHNCPRDRWTNSTECLETREFAKKCKDVLTTM